jgi:hypothetical protein
MNAAHAIRHLEEAGFTHQQATGGVEVVQGEVIEKVATRDYVGEQIALVRKDLAEQIGAVRQELAEQIGAVRQDLAQETGSIRQELARQIGDTRAELMGAIKLPDVLDERLPCGAARRGPWALRHPHRNL